MAILSTKSGASKGNWVKTIVLRVNFADPPFLLEMSVRRGVNWIAVPEAIKMRYWQN